MILASQARSLDTRGLVRPHGSPEEPMLSMSALVALIGLIGCLAVLMEAP